MYISLFMCCIFIICIFFQRKSKIINTISIDNSNCIKGIMAICVVLHHLSGRTNLTGMFSDFGAICLVLAKVDTFMNNKKCVKQCERVQQSTAMSSN